MRVIPVNINIVNNTNSKPRIKRASAVTNPYVQTLSFRSRLHDCINANDLEGFKAELERGVNVNIRDDHDRTPLYAACERGKLEFVKELLKREETDVNAIVGDYEDTALRKACYDGYTDIVKELVKRKDIDVNYNEGTRNALSAACEQGNLDTVKVLLSREDLNPNLVGYETMTPLIRLCYYHFSGDSESRDNQKLEIIEELLKRKDLDPNFMPNPRDNGSALMSAASRDFIKAAEALLKRPDIKINLRRLADGGTTAFEHASSQIAKMLAAREDFDPNGLCYNDKTQIMVAAKKTDIFEDEEIEKMINKGNVDFSHQDTKDRNTLLHIIAKRRPKLFIKLLERDDLNFNIQDASGETVGMYVACNYDIPELSQLLEKDGIDFTLKYKDNGWTVMDWYDNHCCKMKKKLIRDYMEYQALKPVDIDALSPENNIYDEGMITKYFLRLISNKRYKEAVMMLNRTPFINLKDKEDFGKKISDTKNTELINAVFDYTLNRQKRILADYNARRTAYLQKLAEMDYKEAVKDKVAYNTVEGFKVLMNRKEFNPNECSLFEQACKLDKKGDLAKQILSKYDDIYVGKMKINGSKEIKALIADYEKRGKYQIKYDRIKQNLLNTEQADLGAKQLRDFVMSGDFNPDISDEAENNLLHVISGTTNEKARGLIQILTDKGVNIDSKNIAGQTPLMIAIKQLFVPRSDSEKESILSNIKFILDKGANVDERDLNGQTPFHYACMTSSIALMTMILSKDPNIFIRDLKGNKPSKYLKTDEMRKLVQNYVRDMF